MEPQKSKLSAEFFFLSLGVLVTLITSVTAFLNLVFETLNKRFPDVLNATYQYGFSTYQYEGIRGALATLIIFFPVFLIVSYYWRKYAQTKMSSVDAVIRKWQLYIILFLSAVVGVVDLVALVRYFISGEITMRFILKVVTVLVTVLLVGFYYMKSLKDQESMTNKVSFTFAGAAALLVLAAIIYSFAIMGSPMQQRKLRMDDKRVGDLQNLQYQVINYWQQKEKLPENLEALVSPLTGASLPTPPEMEKGEKYEYAVKSPTTFELCATFALPMPKGWQEYGGRVYGGGWGGPIMSEVAVPPMGPGFGVNESWDHQAGRTCYERTIDPDLYPPFPKPTTTR